MYEAEYRSKLMTPVAAVELIPARGTLSMGMAISEPPALLKALKDRVQRRGNGGIEELRVYYSHSVAAAATTILKYEYMDVIKPHPFFPTVSRADAVRTGAAGESASCFLYAGQLQRDASHFSGHRN